MRPHKFFILVLAFLGTQQFYSQEKIERIELERRIERDFKFNKEDFDKELEISVSSETEEINFNLSGKLTNGKMYVQIMDPNGKHEGSFELKTVSVDTRDQQSHSVSNGNFCKAIANPISGKWKIFIEANEAKGNLSVEVKNF